MKYRITKYNPKYRDSQGVYLKEEWISCSDIGYMYGEHKLQIDEYLNIEYAYIAAIRIICRINKCKTFVVNQTEKVYSVWEIRNDMAQVGLPLSEDEVSVFRTVADNKRYSIEDVCVIAKLVLRELLWVQISDEYRRVSFEFGYDYYMYACCPNLTEKEQREIESLGLFVERME